MSDRSRKILALARANQQLSARFKIAPKRKTSQELNVDEIFKDPDYEPSSGKKKKNCPDKKYPDKKHVRRLFDFPAEMDASFESAPIKLDFLTTKAFKDGVPEPEQKDTPRGISVNRKQNLIKKLTAMGISQSRIMFWQSLPENHEDTNLDD